MTRSTLLLIASTALVAGCGGGGGGGGGSSSPPSFTVSGTAMYEKKGIDATTATLTTTLTNTPVPNALVEVVDTSNGSTIATGATNALGEFSVSVAASFEAGTILVRVRTKSSVAFTEVEVGNNSGVVYSVSSGTFSGAQAGLSLLATADDATGRVAGAFNIFTQVMRGMEFVRSVDPAATFPALAAIWEIGQTPVIPPCTCATHVHLGGDTVFVFGVEDSASDTDDFDDSVILHEFAHYLQANFSRNSSPGGDHINCDPSQDLDYRLSFGEGWGNAFAQMVLGDPIYVDTKPAGGFTQNMETACLDVIGAGSESALNAVFWDLFDGPTSGIISTDADTLDLGFGPIWQAMKWLRDNATDIYVGDFLVALVVNGSITVAQWDANFGPGGPQDLGLQTPLPAFPPFFLDPNTPPTAQGVNASLGQQSLFVASQYYEVTLTSAGTLTINVAITNPGTTPGTNNLDLYLWETGSSDPDGHPPGERLAVSETDTGVETISMPLSAGTYMIQVRARSFPIGEAAAGFTIETTFP